MEIYQRIRRKKSNSGLDQVVLNGVAGGGGSRGDAELAVNGGQVPVDGAGTDDELFGYLSIGEPLGHETEHFHLTRGQASRIDE